MDSEDKFHIFGFDINKLIFFLVKFMGYGIIMLSMIIKLPQVFKIVLAKNSKGLSFIATLLELLSLSFNCCYSLATNFPFSAWGEVLFLCIETFFIALFILWFDDKKNKSIIFSVIYLTGMYILMKCPLKLLWFLALCNIPLTICGKLLQALKNYQNGNTGQLSALTVTSQFLGCIARIFTSIVELGDMLVIMNFVMAAIANFILTFQIYYYWKATEKFLKAD